MTTIAGEVISERTAFAAEKPTDHAAVGVLAGLIWFITLAGFIPDMMRHVTEKAPPYRLITHAHAFLAVT